MKAKPKTKTNTAKKSSRSRSSSRPKGKSSRAKQSNFSRISQRFLTKKPVAIGFITLFAAIGAYIAFFALAATQVSSTAYCINGTMANGERTHDGAAAKNGVPFGTQYKLLNGSLAGKVVTIKDRSAPGATGLDVWMGSCSAARSYGRQNISIEQVNGAPPVAGNPGGEAPCGHPTISRGNTGGRDCVIHLQQHLNTKGYNLATDGAWGNLTDNAVRDFQRKQGFAGAGTVGPSTWERLHGGSSAPAPADPNAPYGSIGEKWRQLGGAGGFLGNPTGPESPACFGGRHQTFQGGIIYWHPNTGAREVHGSILGKYNQFNRECGLLRYPITDELPAANGGRYNGFQGGRIYWHPNTGAHEVHGSILATYQQLGGSGGSLRYPTSDEYGITGGARSNFEGGTLTWCAATGQVKTDGSDCGGSQPPTNQPPANKPPTSNPPSTGSGTRYKVRSVFNNRCVDADVAAGENRDGGRVQQWDCISSQTNQLIRLNDKGGGWYEMKFQHDPQRCVDVYGFGKGNGASVVQWPCNGSTNQLVKKVYQGSGSQGGYYQLEFKHAPGMCLDFDSNQNRNNGKVQLWQCLSNNTNQRFYLLER